MIDSILLYVHRNHEAYQGRGAQDGHLDFHTAPGIRKEANTRVLAVYILRLADFLSQSDPMDTNMQTSQHFISLSRFGPAVRRVVGLVSRRAGF